MSKNVLNKHTTTQYTTMTSVSKILNLCLDSSRAMFMHFDESICMFSSEQTMESPLSHGIIVNWCSKYEFHLHNLMVCAGY